MAFSALEALQAFGAGRQMAIQDRDRSRREETRANVSDRVRAGDLSGASTEAAAGGEYDLAGHLNTLDDHQRTRALQEVSVGGQLAEELGTLPMDQRATAFQQSAALLHNVGFSEDEIRGYGADLSDEALAGHARNARRVQRALHPQQPQNPTTLQQNYEWLNSSGHGGAATSYLRRETEPLPHFTTDGEGRVISIQSSTPQERFAVNPQTGERLRLNPQTGQLEPVQGGAAQPQASGTFR